MFFTYYLIYLHKNRGGRCYCLHFPRKGTNTQMLKSMCEVTQLGRGEWGWDPQQSVSELVRYKLDTEGVSFQMCSSPPCPTGWDKMNRKSEGCFVEAKIRCNLNLNYSVLTPHPGVPKGTSHFWSSQIPTCPWLMKLRSCLKGAEHCLRSHNPSVSEPSHFDSQATANSILPNSNTKMPPCTWNSVVLISQCQEAGNRVGQAQRITRMFYRNKFLVQLENGPNPSKLQPTADATVAWSKACSPKMMATKCPRLYS